MVRQNLVGWNVSRWHGTWRSRWRGPADAHWNCNDRCRGFLGNGDAAYDERGNGYSDHCPAGVPTLTR